MYSCSSLIGLVSSKRKWQRPPNSWAIPKLSAIALGWPRWRYPFGSGGKRVTTSETLPSRTSAATISRMKSRRSGEAGVPALTRLLLVISIRVVQYIAMSCCVGGSLEPLHHLVCHWIPDLPPGVLDQLFATEPFHPDLGIKSRRIALTALGTLLSG